MHAIAFSHALSFCCLWLRLRRTSWVFQLDNVLVDAIGTAAERAMLTDFGVNFDLQKNRVANQKVAMFYEGFCRGGALIALAPEVLLLQPGPGVYLYYGKNDVWALGMILHALMSSAEHTPFNVMAETATYSDEGFRPVDQELLLVPSLVLAVRGLLRVDPSHRLSAVEAAVLLEAVDVEIEEARVVEVEERMAAQLQVGSIQFTADSLLVVRGKKTGTATAEQRKQRV